MNTNTSINRAGCCWHVYVDGALRHAITVLRGDAEPQLQEIKRLYEGVYPGALVVVK